MASVAEELKSKIA